MFFINISISMFVANVIFGDPTELPQYGNIPFQGSYDM